MASGSEPLVQDGLPPPGPGIGVASGPPDVRVDPMMMKNLEALWDKISAPGLSYKDTNREIQAFWTFLTKDESIPNRIHLPQIGRVIHKLLRFHLNHVLDHRWTPFQDDLKTRLGAVMSSSEKLLKKEAKLYREFSYLQRIHASPGANPWSGPLLKAILTGKPEWPQSLEYFQLECGEACVKRLTVMVDTGLFLPAFNLAKYAVENVFRSDGNVGKDYDFWTWKERRLILDVYIGLMFKLKKDSEIFFDMMREMKSEIVGMNERFNQRLDEAVSGMKDPFRKLWDTKGCVRILKSLTEYSMLLVAKGNEAMPDTEKIVSAWANLCSKSYGDVADMEIEVQKFGGSVGRPEQLYEIGYQLYEKCGGKLKALSVETMLKGFTYDLNKKEAAISNKDEKARDQAEASMSYGMQRLALVLRDHIPMARECILTAFSLTPTQKLMNEITNFAQICGFVQGAEADMNVQEVERTRTWEDVSRLANNDHAFYSGCESMIGNLEKKKYTRAYCGPVKEKKRRNLDALLTIYGDLITESSNYNPVATPCPSFTPGKLGLNQRLVSDLLTVVNSPRWHPLSWVLDWATLQDRCMDLLRTPEKRHPTQELKYLVIDYTQFDDWSSDEEIVATTGIEEGFEDWDVPGVDDSYHTSIVERGLRDEEVGNFNAIPKLVEADDDELSEDDYIEPKDYLAAGSFLSSREEIRDQDLLQNDMICNRLEISYDFQNECSKYRAASCRAWLRKVVPGLDGDLSFLQHESQLDIRVVQVKPGTSSSSSPSPSTSTKPSTKKQKKSPAKKSSPQTLPANAEQPSTQPPTAIVQNVPTAIVQNPPVLVASPVKNVVVQQQPQPAIERKVQYVYKQGGQTVVIDYPVADADALAKLKPIPQQPQQVRLPVVSTPPKIIMTSAGAQVGSVDSLANSLISQIQTPLTPTSTGQLVNTQSQDSLPKFQLAFGQSPKPETAIATIGANGEMIVKRLPIIQAAPGTSSGVSTGIIQVQRPPEKIVLSRPVNPHQIQTQRCIIQPGQKVNYNAIIQQKLMSATPVPAQVVRTPPVTQQIQDNSQVDLVRQLNVARAQGHVVLQQWGDKQVLVHKATGRWIMRQGNKLVTVPPQALGITPTTPVATSPKVEVKEEEVEEESKMCSSTMEQIEEFNSILESKFKDEPESPVKKEEPNNEVSIKQDVMFIGSVKSEVGSLSPASTSSTDVTSTNDLIGGKRNSPAAIRPTQLSSTFVKPPPKTQEDPDTLKRIQQILDDYNEQIRNSPDLQNRPAPRRRGQGPVVSPKRKAADKIKDKSSVRQIMIPPSLAASLAASGRQLMVVTGPGGKKMIAMRPMTAGKSSNTCEVIFTNEDAEDKAPSPCSSPSVAEVEPTVDLSITPSTSSDTLTLARPSSPGLEELGIPMEMTSMEAEISGGLLDEDLSKDFPFSSEVTTSDNILDSSSFFSKPPMFFDDDYDLLNDKSSPDTATSDDSMTTLKRKIGEPVPSRGSKRTRKPSVKVVEAAEAALQSRKATGGAVVSLQSRKLKLQRGSLGSESNCSTSSSEGASSSSSSQLLIRNVK